MPRGGKRKGAGRKPQLEPLDRLRAGARCESLWREAFEAKLSEAIAAATENVQNEHRTAQRVPISKRKDWIKSEEGQIHIEDVEDALWLDQGLSDESRPSRLIQVKAKRPKGIWSGIFATVAEAEGIPPRMAESCLKEFRMSQDEDIS